MGHILDTIKSKGLSVAAVAREAGLSREAIYMVDAGRRSPNISTVIDLSRAIGVKPVELFPQLDRPPCLP